MQNTRKYNLLYFEFHILWRFIGFPYTSHKRAKISNDSSKFLTQFYGRLHFRKHLAMLLSISNLIYDIESISSVCMCVCGWVSTQYTYVCVGECVFALRSATIFHILPSLFYTLPFGLCFWLAMGKLECYTIRYAKRYISHTLIFPWISYMRTIFPAKRYFAWNLILLLSISIYFCSHPSLVDAFDVCCRQQEIAPKSSQANTKASFRSNVVLVVVGFCSCHRILLVHVFHSPTVRMPNWKLMNVLDWIW